MAGERTSYVYGSAAQRAPARPYYDRGEELRRRQREQREYDQRERRKRRVQSKPRIDRVAVFWTAVTFAAVMAVGLFYLRLQFRATYLSKSVVNLQSEVVDMEKNNVAAESELDNSVNLDEIYKKATKELGMKKATGDQIRTYESKKSTQIRQNGDIPAE